MAKHSLQFDDDALGSDDGVSSGCSEGESTLDKRTDDKKAERPKKSSRKADSASKASRGAHSHESLKEMDAKASAGKHAPSSEELTKAASGKHAPKSESKDDFSPDAKKYAEQSKAARKRRASIFASGAIAVIGTLVGVGLLAYSHFIGIQEEAQGMQRVGSISPSTIEEGLAILHSSGSAAISEGLHEAQAQIEQQESMDSGAPAGSVESRLDQFGRFEVTASALAGLPADEKPFAFALDEEDAALPELSTDNRKKLEDAIESASEADSQVSCILIDLETGRGIAANLDAQPYGASAFKGPFCAYLCESADSDSLDIAGVKEGIESVIVYSDNDLYDGLRMSFEGEGLAKWLESCGISDDEQLYRDWYPFQSARQSSMMWLHMNEYLHSDSENARWLSGLLAETQVSFIRNAIGSKEVTVRDKGGWYAATWEDMSTWNGTCDAGIIECNGHTYLMSIMTGQPVTEASMASVEHIAEALWTAREDLA